MPFASAPGARHVTGVQCASGQPQLPAGRVRVTTSL